MATNTNGDPSGHLTAPQAVPLTRASKKEAVLHQSIEKSEPGEGLPTNSKTMPPLCYNSAVQHCKTPQEFIQLQNTYRMKRRQQREYMKMMTVLPNPKVEDYNARRSLKYGNIARKLQEKQKLEHSQLAMAGQKQNNTGVALSPILGNQPGSAASVSNDLTSGRNYPIGSYFDAYYASQLSPRPSGDQRQREMSWGELDANDSSEKTLSIHESLVDARHSQELSPRLRGDQSQKPLSMDELNENGSPENVLSVRQSSVDAKHPQEFSPRLPYDQRQREMSWSELDENASSEKTLSAHQSSVDPEHPQELSPKSRVDESHEALSISQSEEDDLPSIASKARQLSIDVSYSHGLSPRLSSDQLSGELSISETDSDEESEEDKDQIISYADHEDYLGLHMVQLSIGTGDNKLHFIIHRKLLCEKIPKPFDDIFLGNHRSARARFKELSTKHTEGFRLLVHWLYTGSIENTGGEFCLMTLFQLYALACKYRLVEVQNKAMNCIVSGLDEFRTALHDKRFENLVLAHVQFAYKETPRTSKLRLFCAIAMAEMLKKRLGGWTHEEVSSLLHDGSALAIDAVIMAQGILKSQIQIATKPPKSNFYHVWVDPNDPGYDGDLSCSDESDCDESDPEESDIPDSIEKLDEEIVEESSNNKKREASAEADADGDELDSNDLVSDLDERITEKSNNNKKRKV